METQSEELSTGTTVSPRPALVRAPFSEQQIINLNKFQQSEMVHPFTCGGNRTDENHLDGQGVLRATESGWECPYCGYKQNWAHAFMADGSMLAGILQCRNEFAK